MIDVALVNSLLDDILKIKCSKYLYGIKDDEPNSPEYIIKVMDKTEHILTVYPKKEDDYTVVSSDNPTTFSLYAWNIDNIIKKFDEMLGDGDEKGVESDRSSI